MKFLYCFLLVAVFFFEVNAFNRDRRQLGQVRKCEAGTHVFASVCGINKPNLGEPTCEQPEAQDLGDICDLVSCYCDTPNLRDSASGLCVAPADCPKSS